MEVDDDIFVVKDSKPKEPLEDPLALMIGPDIISLDSSDEELPICKPTQTFSGKSFNPSNPIQNNIVVKKHNIYDHSNATTPVLESIRTLNESHEPIAFIIPKPSASIQNSMENQKNMETRNDCILTADETSQQQNVKSSGLKNNPVRFKSKIITEPTIAIGKKARNTVIDLNLNVNKYEKTCAITSQPNKMPQSLSSPCNSSKQYNVALGLVLNVNNSDQSGDSCEFTTASMSRINDVALDVNVNVNNQDNSATGKSGQVEQNMLLPTPRQPTLKLDKNKLNSFRKWYSCLKCSFQTTNIDFINAHNCSGRPQSEQLVAVAKMKKKLLRLPNIVFQSEQNVYECKICKIKNPDFKVMKLHICLPKCPPLSKTINQMNSIEKMYCCAVCSFQTTDLETFKVHTSYTLSNINTEKNCIELTCLKETENLEQKSLEMPRDNLQNVFSCTDKVQTEYLAQNTLELSINKTTKVLSCVACKFQTVDIEIMKSHECTLSKKLIDNVQQIENVLPPKVLSCVSCSFQTTDLEVIKSHNCLLLSNSNSNIQGDLIKQMYCCSLCSFQTSDVEIVKSHFCTSPKVEDKNDNATTSKNIKSLVQGGSESSVNNIQKELKKKKTLHSCGACSCKTKCMCSSQDTNKLSNFNKNNLQQMQNITISKNMYCCVSCSFKTLKFNDVKSHRCRKYLSKSTSIKSNSKSPITQEKDITCPLCVTKFHDKYMLFQHLRITHLKFIHRLRCHYCDTFIIDTVFVKHLKEIHKSAVLPSEYVEGYECKHCKCFIYDPEHVAAHLNAHLLFLFDKVASLKLLASTGTISLYTCILCGINTPNIGALLSHFCKPLSNHLSIKGKQPDDPDTIPEKYTRTSEVSCYSCKRQIYNKQLLQCECENMYHISCVNIYATLLPNDEVNNMPNWFCLECNNENVNSLLTARDDIETVDWCLDFADKEYLKEIRKQEIIAKEIKKINERSEKMKQEFQQIKSFIFKSKSEKINNKLVRSVCNIIDSYISAGCD